VTTERTVSGKDLKDLLDHVEDTRELVLRVSDDDDAGWRVDEHFLVWAGARAEANDAYAARRERPGREPYVVYLAAEDRADAAEEGLAREFAG